MHIIDAYNPFIYPGDDYAEGAIKTKIPVTYMDDDDETYLKKLERFIPQAYETFKPELVIYNAGTDCMEGDPLGNLNITSRGIIDRDELMFKYAL